MADGGITGNEQIDEMADSNEFESHNTKVGKKWRKSDKQTKSEFELEQRQ